MLGSTATGLLPHKSSTKPISVGLRSFYSAPRRPAMSASKWPVALRPRPEDGFWLLLLASPAPARDCQHCPKSVGRDTYRQQLTTAADNPYRKDI